MHYLKLRNKNDNFIWPSFVDALASLLIVIIFILMIFVISQYYISQKLSGKDQVLTQLETEILEITKQLSIEKEMGRTERLANEYESRIIDIDIILFGNKIVNNKKLVIPHPRYSHRDFVLIPLLEIYFISLHISSSSIEREILDISTISIPMLTHFSMYLLTTS